MGTCSQPTINFLIENKKQKKSCFFFFHLKMVIFTALTREVRWPSDRVSDSGARGRRFDPHSGCRVVSLSKIHLPPKKVLVISRKRWLRPDMTEKLLMGRKASTQTNKQNSPKSSSAIH